MNQIYWFLYEKEYIKSQTFLILHDKMLHFETSALFLK